MSRPVLILSAPRSYSSLFGTMLGQHPDLYGLPEVKLFIAETVGSLIVRFTLSRVQKLHGLLRVIGQQEFGAQTDESVAEAWRWLRARRSWTTQRLWNHLAAAAAPRDVVEAAPVTAMFRGSLDRARRFCPQARFIHLTRHPRPSCRSIQDGIEWLDQRYHTPLRFFVDPEAIWAQAHRNILSFVASLPPDQVLRIRGEDLMDDAPDLFRRVTAFLGLPMDAAALDAMLHPERSVYAHIGPAQAPFGSDPKFLANPHFRPRLPSDASLDGPLDWPRAPRRGFRAQTFDIASRLGYE